MSGCEPGNGDQTRSRVSPVAGGAEVDPAAFARRRADLLSRDFEVGADRRRALVDLTDEWLVDVFHASGAAALGCTLVGIGGFGRGELSPGSDLDLLLLQPLRTDTSDAAQRIWYPIWDAGLRLDYSIRTLAEARDLAREDLRVLLGLLDARAVVGNGDLLKELRRDVFTDWRSHAVRRLPDLRGAVDARSAAHGELAHLLEPDLKESYGGLRDITVLRAIDASWIADSRVASLTQPATLLRDVRDALHLEIGRGTDRLVLQEQAPVAARLGFPSADDLLRAVSAAGRTIEFASDTVWHEVGRAIARRQGSRPRWLRRSREAGPVRRPLALGVVEQDGEAVLAREADPHGDPVLVLRAAAAAAQAGLRLSPHAVERLAVESSPLPVPWPRAAREWLVSLLGAGRSALPVWESLDQAGVIARLIPPWAVVRSAPQHNPVHRFTVDRHLVETAFAAAALTRDVGRPDLLLVGALLHDIGKGRPGDHTENGARIVADLAPRLGFDESDCDVLVKLVRFHLLLPETATRRDLADPATVAAVAALVETPEMLDLLDALTEADAQASGPAAWSPWKATLVAELVSRTRAAMAGAEPPPLPKLTAEQLALASAPGVQVLVSDRDSVIEITVAADDQVGLLAAVAGALAMNRLEVKAARTQTVGPRAVTTWIVVRSFGAPVEPTRLSEDVRRGLIGSLDLRSRLRDRAAAYAGRTGASPPAPRVTSVPGAASAASVIEVRAHDAPGLLFTIAGAISAAGAQIDAAHAETMGSEAVDVFYVAEAGGGPPGPERLAAVCESIRRALAAEATAASQ